MWFRAFFISCVNVVATVICVVLALSLFLSSSTSIVLMNGASWAVAAIVTWICAHWIFAPRMPTSRDLLIVALVHGIVFALAYLVYGIFLSYQGPHILLSPELLVQGALETIVVLLEGYRLRRRRLQAAFGEGMTV